MEVPPDKQEVDVIPEVGVAVELKRKIEDLEQEISTCCEGGDYERAGGWSLMWAWLIIPLEKSQYLACVSTKDKIFSFVFPAVLDDELNTLKDKHSAIVPTN